MNLQSEQIVRKAYQIARDKDAPGWIALFTEDGTFSDKSIEAVYHGPEGLGEAIEIYATAFPDLHREIYHLYSTDEMVVVQLALRGTHLGPLRLPRGTIPATGNRIDVPCCDVFELSERKIRRFDCYPSASLVLTQLGVISSFDTVLEMEAR